MNFASRGTEGIRGLRDCWEAISLLSYFLTADRGSEIKTKKKMHSDSVSAVMESWNPHIMMTRLHMMTEFTLSQG